MGEDCKNTELEYQEEFEAFQVEVEEAIRQEMGDDADFTEEEIAEMAACEEESDSLKKLKEESTMLRAVADDLVLVNEEQQSALRVASASDEAARAELAQLE